MVPLQLYFSWKAAVYKMQVSRAGAQLRLGEVTTSDPMSRPDCGKS